MASKKQLNALILLGGKVDPSLRKAMQSSTKSFQSFGKAAAKIGGAIATYVSINAIKEFGKESVEAAKKQIEAETKLEAVLKNVRSLQKQGPYAYLQAKKELIGLAGELQNVGVISDEVTLAGFQQLATFQMSQKEISVLAGGMTDLLAQQKGLNATQEDAVGIANMVGKVMDGQVGALRRVGISFTAAQERALKTGDRIKRAAVLAEVLQMNVGGVNEALAKTDQGKIQNMTNRFGDMKEEIGKRLLPLQAKFAAWFSDKIPMIQGKTLKFISLLDNPKLGQGLKAGLDFASSAAEVLIPLLIGTYNIVLKVSKFVINNWPIIEPMIWGIVAAIAAWKAITLGMLIYQGIMAGIKAGTVAATLAQWGFNAALAPFAAGIIVATLAVGLLVAAGVLLYRNWDTVKAKALAMAQTIKSAMMSVASFIGGAIKGYVNNIYIKPLNMAIRMMNKLGQVKVPDWVPVIGGKGFNFKIPEIPAFAKGGFANRPSVFGEAGLEAAIPIKYKNPRSLSLLNQTAKAIGADEKSGQNVIQLIYSPQLSGSESAEVMAALKAQAEQFKAWVEAYFAEKERVSFG